MCGIAGLVDSRLPRERLDECGATMIGALVHRGPDDGGVWSSESNHLVLGHRRLAIQDLSETGRQPMHSASGRYCVVFNGEIYNFREIATDLAGHGHRFRGHSDTEVLLAAVEEWGLVAAVERFVGMFAFALWDREDRLLHLCRDRIGEKPLYYGWIGDVFCFASELKAVEAVIPKAGLDIDTNALALYLKYGYIPAPYSIYQGLFKLLPGSIFTLRITDPLDRTPIMPVPDRSDQSPTTYWSIHDSIARGAADPFTDAESAVDALDTLLRRTVRRQLIADVNIGLFLSGGIDSSTVSAIARHESTGSVRTYTIGFREKEYDESKYAERIAEHLGTDHLTLHVSPKDALQVVPDLSSIYDEPFADSSQIPAYLVSKLAREHVTVCLSGDGGDELFAGYNRYMWTELIWEKLSPCPAVLRKLAGRMLAAPTPGFWDSLYGHTRRLTGSNREKQRLVGLKLQKLAGFMQQDSIDSGYDYLLSYWHHPHELLRAGSVDSDRNYMNTRPDTMQFMDRAMYLDQVLYLPGDNLAKVDRASMAVSLETRLPLLSHEVIDLSWRMPVSMKYREDTSKWALRQVLYRYVPRELIDRPKMGFSVPVDHWLRDELSGWSQDLLADMSSLTHGLLDGKRVQQAWKEHAGGKRDHSHRLWTILMLLSWLEARR